MTIKSIIDAQAAYEAPACEVIIASVEAMLCESEGGLSADPGDWTSGQNDWFKE